MFRPAFLPYVWMLLGAFAFAIMSLLTSELREEVPWQWIALARSALAMLFASTLVFASGAKFVFIRPRTLWMRSFAGSISLLCGFYAMTHYEVSVVLTLTNMYPLWVAILSWPMLGLAPSRDTWLAAVVGVVGVAVLSVGSASAESPAVAAVPGHVAVASSGVTTASEFQSPLALAASLVSAFTSAIALIGLHRLKGLDSRAIVSHFSAVSSLLCLVAITILAFSRSGVAGSSPWTSWWPLAMLVGIGLCATVGQIFLTKAFAAGSPARVSVIGLSQTGITMLFEMCLGKHFHWLTLVGIVLIIAPTAWVLLRQTGTVGTEEQNEESAAITPRTSSENSL